MPALAAIFGFLKAISAPLLKWWGSLKWNDRIIVIVIVIVVATIYVQYKIIKHNESEIIVLNTKISELVTKADIAKIDGRINEVNGQIEQHNSSIQKLQSDLAKQRGNVKPPTITGMSNNDIVEAFKKIGQ